jgi:hypothetical protein
MEIYFHFLNTFKQQTEWFAFLDIDEFLVLKNINNIAIFMQEYESRADCLYFNWLIYGHSGKLRREPGYTLTSYLRRAARIDVHTKMICRSAAIDPASVRAGYIQGRGAFHHFMDNYELPGVRCMDVLHAPTDGYSADFPASADVFAGRDGFSNAAIERAYIAHFQFRSEEDFLRRWRRGGFDNGEQWRQLYEAGAHRAILDVNNAIYDSYLADYWWHHTAPALRIQVDSPFGSPPFTNVAANKPAFQSSIYQPSEAEPPGSRVSGGGNNGRRTGTYGFHTEREQQPWWCVDLLAPHRIGEIHIYNRSDSAVVARRAADLEVMASHDTDHWTTLLARASSEPFGLDGTPLVISVTSAEPYRFILVRLPGTGFLHLDEVEVYGEPI